MIGGTDLIIPAVGKPAALEACARIVQQSWPNARFEDAETGKRYGCADNMQLDRVHELLAYRDVEAEAAWDRARDNAPSNSMLYLILGADALTVVVDDPSSPEMQSILESIRSAMCDQIQ